MKTDATAAALLAFLHDGCLAKRILNRQSTPEHSCCLHRSSIALFGRCPSLHPSEGTTLEVLAAASAVEEGMLVWQFALAGRRPA